jgi:hypothetical protein
MRSSENRYAVFGTHAKITRWKDNVMERQGAQRPFASMCFAGLVAFGEAIRPDPIPNSAVKRFRANGTMSQDLGE